MAENEIRLEFVEDLTPAAWLGDESGPFGRYAGAVIPPRFEAYARVFQPASLAGVPVSWRDIATAHLKVFHPEVQFESITPHDRSHLDNRGLWDYEPDVGNAWPIVRPLLAALLPHTTTPDGGWFCVWEGSGGMAHPEFDAKVRLPWRAYYLMRGPLAAVVEDFGPWSTLGHHGASIWWPDDRAWSVATEVDLRWTYVGGTAQLIDDLLADSELEAPRAAHRPPRHHRRPDQRAVAEGLNATKSVERRRPTQLVGLNRRSERTLGLRGEMAPRSTPCRMSRTGSSENSADRNRSRAPCVWDGTDPTRKGHQRWTSSTASAARSGPGS